jgi:uncharacterized membrane protein
MELIKETSLIIEYLAVAIIVGMVGYSTALLLFFLIFGRETHVQTFHDYKDYLGRALLLGLTVLVAADVIRTVALEPTLDNIAALGLLVLVRTFLGWALVVEIDGHWPWRPPHSGAEPGEHTQ